MYEAKEHWIAYQKEKQAKIKHDHTELFATLSAASVIGTIAIIVLCIV